MDSIELLKNRVLGDNDIFLKNGFYFKTNEEFINSGISDRFQNQFYFRFLKPGPNKYKVTVNDITDEVSCEVRFVAQVSTKINKSNALQSFVAQIASKCQDFTVVVMSYSDDTTEIFRSEHKKDIVIDKFNLISIDFKIIEERVLSSEDCECLCISNC